MKKHEQPVGLFHSIVLRHLDHYPEMSADDLYKLVFQAAMGSEHAALELDLAHQYLIAEAQNLNPDPEPPLAMPLSPDHRLVRIHIGPFLSAGGNLYTLARAFVGTSQLFKPSADRLWRYWSWILAMAAQDDLPFSLPLLQRYGDRQRTQGYPAVHHSSQYRRLYRPAYRVILKDLITLPPGCVL